MLTYVRTPQFCYCFETHRRMSPASVALIDIEHEQHTYRRRGDRKYSIWYAHMDARNLQPAVCTVPGCILASLTAENRRGGLRQLMPETRAVDGDKGIRSPAIIVKVGNFWVSMMP
jgi:hypothetical protein